MAEITAGPGSLDDVRTIQRRRALDETGMRLSLRLAELDTVSVARDDAEVIGIAVAHDSEDERCLGDLFVEPSYQGQGLGAALLESAFGGASDASRAMLFDARDTSAHALAFRFGLAVRSPILRFAGAIPKEEELVKMAAGDYRFQVEKIDSTVHALGLNELDRQTRGTTRLADHAEFAVAASGHAFLLGGECVGYAYVWPDGRVGPLACASEAYLVQIFAYAIVTLQRTYGASWCTMLVPGFNRRVARAALRGGLRIEEMLMFAGDAFSGDLSTYVGFHRLLL